MEQNPDPPIHKSINPAPCAIDVSAALIFRQGKLLITRRHAKAHLGGLWEFPGGKRESDETFKQCLVREIREELGVTIAVGGLFESITHAYPEKTVHLKFFVCRLLDGKPQPLGCAAVNWTGKSELVNYAFPAADARLLQKLQNSPELWAQI
jgi:mutator protein MutT